MELPSPARALSNVHRGGPLPLPGDRAPHCGRRSDGPARSPALDGARRWGDDCVQRTSHGPAPPSPGASAVRSELRSPSLRRGGRWNESLAVSAVSIAMCEYFSWPPRRPPGADVLARIASGDSQVVTSPRSFGPRSCSAQFAARRLLLNLRWVPDLIWPRGPITQESASHGRLALDAAASCTIALSRRHRPAASARNSSMPAVTLSDSSMNMKCVAPARSSVLLSGISASIRWATSRQASRSYSAVMIRARALILSSCSAAGGVRTRRGSGFLKCQNS